MLVPTLGLQLLGVTVALGVLRFIHSKDVWSDQNEILVE